ncbi:MAG: hypothetical protein NTW25_07735 [Candidatus Kapabacteria bacterium]|nr:hypothetical protein [Candidatus Kapabacteria bacterium]
MKKVVLFCLILVFLFSCKDATSPSESSTKEMINGKWKWIGPFWASDWATLKDATYEFNIKNDSLYFDEWRLVYSPDLKKQLPYPVNITAYVNSYHDNYIEFTIQKYPYNIYQQYDSLTKQYILITRETNISATLTVPNKDTLKIKMHGDFYDSLNSRQHDPYWEDVYFRSQK